MHGHYHRLHLYRLPKEFMNQTAIDILKDKAVQISEEVSLMGEHLPVGTREKMEEKLRKTMDAVTFFEIEKMGGLSGLCNLVRAWGLDKEIIGPDAKATAESQYLKLLEEVEEIGDGLDEGNAEEVLDGIGDSTVVLILLAELCGVSFESCLLGAYRIISKRTGVMKNGQFHKDC